MVLTRSGAVRMAPIFSSVASVSSVPSYDSSLAKELAKKELKMSSYDAHGALDSR